MTRLEQFRGSRFGQGRFRTRGFRGLRPAPGGGGTAPSFTVNHTLTANELTITADSVTGDPTPTVTLTTLTLDGVDVLADASGGFPSWTYFIPSAATVVYGLTATNGVSPDATEGATVVYAPADTTAPTFDPISYTAATRTLTLPNLDEGGTVVWATSDTADTPTFTVAGGWAGDANYETGSATIIPGESTVLDITATTPDGSRKLTVYVYDAANNLSSPDSVTITVDNTAATLSSATGTQTGQTTATWGVTSNEAGGTIYAGVRPSASSALTAAQLIAGSGGAGVAWDSDTTPTADSANGGSFTGLTAATDYRVDVVQVDSFGKESAVASSAEFTTASASYTAPVIDNTGTGYLVKTGGFATSSEDASTFSIWFTPETLTGAHYITKSKFAGLFDVRYNEFGTLLITFTWGDATFNQSLNNALSVGTEAHLQISVDTTTDTLEIFLDGTPIMTTATAAWTTTNGVPMHRDMYIFSNDSGADIGDMTFRDVMLFNAVVSNASLYNSGTPPDPSTLGASRLVLIGGTGYSATDANAGTNADGDNFTSNGTFA